MWASGLPRPAVEVIEGNQNTITRAACSSLCDPYYHMGARAKYVFNDKWTVTGYMTNGWNNVIATTGQNRRRQHRLQPNKKLTITEKLPRRSARFLRTGQQQRVEQTCLTPWSPTAPRRTLPGCRG